MSAWLSSKWKPKPATQPAGDTVDSAAQSSPPAAPSRAFGGEDYLDPTLPAEIDNDDEPLSKRVWIKCGTVCCTIIGGILLISGIIFIVGSSAGGATTSEASYAAAASTYQQGSTPGTLLTLNVSVNGYVAAFSSVVLSIANSHGTPSATSTSFAASVPVVTGTTALTIGVGTSRFTVPAPVSSLQSASIGCDSSSCAVRDDGSACTNTTTAGAITCNASSLGLTCRTRYGPNATFAALSAGLSSCTFNSTCGSCSYLAYLQNLCVVFSRASDTAAWTQNAAYASCEYPFTGRSYGASFVSPLSVTLRVASDPYLALQQYTQGTNQFGSTPGTTSGSGIGLVVTGAIVVSCCVAAFVYLICTAKAAAEEEAEEEEIRRARGLRGKKMRDALRAARMRSQRKPETELEPRRAALYTVELSRREAVESPEPREV